jgi:hypothetical protein
MKNKKLIFGLMAVAAGGTLAVQAQIPYANVGTENPITYTFTATATGPITAVLTGAGFGLDDHSSTLGQSFNMGNVTAGDTLTFVINVINPSLGWVYSNPALNGTYDGGVGHNHVYSVPYDASSNLLDPSIPSGTYVAFEDLPNYNPPDWNYFDETYVFTDVSTVSSAPDSASTLSLLGLGLTGVGLLRRRLCA